MVVWWPVQPPLQSPLTEQSPLFMSTFWGDSRVLMSHNLALEKFGVVSDCQPLVTQDLDPWPSQGWRLSGRVAWPQFSNVPSFNWGLLTPPAQWEKMFFKSNSLPFSALAVPCPPVLVWGIITVHSQWLWKREKKPSKNEGEDTEHIIQKHRWSKDSFTSRKYLCFRN